MPESSGESAWQLRGLGERMGLGVSPSDPPEPICLGPSERMNGWMESRILLLCVYDSICASAVYL